jgi:putative transcriptional regulator
MSNYESLQHIFLIAMPQLQDPVFNQAVVYLWEYNEEGAKGIIINKPTNSSVGDLLRHLQVTVHDSRVDQHPMLFGGPVASEQGFLIRRQRELDWKTAEKVLKITVSSAREDLVPLAEGAHLEDTLVALGCTSWEPKQLDEEIKKNAWLIAPFNEETLFAAAGDAASANLADVWHGAVVNLGINPSDLSLEAGHA